MIGLHEDLGGKLLLSGPREITDGTLIIGVEPNTRELDVLRSVNGLSRLDAQSAITMEVCGYSVPVLFPHLLLQAKLENALKLDQRERQDVKHVKIMTLVLREFLLDVVTTASAENEKYAIHLLRGVLTILTSENARVPLESAGQHPFLNKIGVKFPPFHRLAEIFLIKSFYDFLASGHPLMPFVKSSASVCQCSA